MSRAPKPDTFIGRLYTALYENAGQPVNVLEMVPENDGRRHHYSNGIRALVNQYDCEIELIDKHTYILKAVFVSGEWKHFTKSKHLAKS